MISKVNESTTEYFRFPAWDLLPPPAQTPSTKRQRLKASFQNTQATEGERNYQTFDCGDCRDWPQLTIYVTSKYCSCHRVIVDTKKLLCFIDKVHEDGFDGRQ